MGSVDILSSFIIKFYSFLPRLVSGGLIFVGFLASAIIFRLLLSRIFKKLPLPAQLLHLFRSVGFYTLIILGTISALGTMGINISALVASLGLTGFALGFALKDAVSNLIAGVLLLLYKPFELGDWISIAGKQGIVESINFRYISLKSDEGKNILIPNSMVFTSVVEKRPQT